jgi:hypothetical protein
LDVPKAADRTEHIVGWLFMEPWAEHLRPQWQILEAEAEILAADAPLKGSGTPWACIPAALAMEDEVTSAR